MPNTAPTFITLGGVVTLDIDGGIDDAHSVLVDADGRIVVAGDGLNFPSFNSDSALLRYDASGQLDRTFGEGGIVLTDFGGSQGSTDMLFQTDGRIVVAGTVF